MTVLLDLTLPRTLDALLTRFADGSHRGCRLEAWLFDNEAARRSAEARLAAAGVQAKLRSAYKPLVHHFLEEAPAAPMRVTIALPNHPEAPAARFRLEAYPLAGLLPAAALAFTEGSDPLAFRVTCDEGPETTVLAPNRMRQDPLGLPALAPCGWLRLWRPDGSLAEDGPLETEYEAAWQAAIAALAAHAWPAQPPLFNVLAIDATLPGIERPLAYGDEVISTAEALHEDFYFSILELLKHRAGRAAADRTLQPGQIVPDIVTADGPLRLTIRLLPAPASRPSRRGPDDLEDADRPPTAVQIATATDALGGELRDIRSVQGRKVLARVFPGDGPALLLSAGQHANETSGIVGALRAARVLRAEHRRFALIPCENPDGNALHHQLRANNPRHMHHAARYSALGDDVESLETEPLHEKAARLALIAEVGARLHLNLHGYPAHEWTRPLSGYLPRGFELWTIPKGFFLILRHLPGHAAAARPFLEALTRTLAEDPALARFNATQLATWAAHAGDVPFPVLNGIPCLIGETERQTLPFQLITEYPDETIYGDAFRLAHTTQTRTALAAAALLREGAL
jgi:hypothetical protein